MTVRIEKDGPVWTVINSRPEARNAVNPESSKALFEAFVEFERDDDAAVAVFWGEGGAFCSGWDLKNAAGLSNDDDGVSVLSFERTTDDGHTRGPMGPSRLQLSKPVIAAIAGPAVAGGMELAMWADIRVMEETAYMGVYCRRWGVPLIDGGTVRLPRLVGQGRALDLILTGRQVMAEECERIGLAEYVVPEGDARSRAEELARDISRLPHRGVAIRVRIEQGGHSRRGDLGRPPFRRWRWSFRRLLGHLGFGHVHPSSEYERYRDRPRRFDIEELRAALVAALDRVQFQGAIDDGFGAFSLTRRPGVEVETANDLSGLFHTRVDDSYEEVQREEMVDEFAFTEFVPTFDDLYFKVVWETLCKLAPVGRMRVLSKGLYNCNSWHRDPEPRLHVPIISNPGSLFVVNHHATHLPADGSVYFTDTRGYHTALNGGERERVHLVAALAQH